MAKLIQDKIKRSLQAAEGLYYRLVLLVGETGSGKTGILRDVADDLGAEVININLALSSELLELTAKQRALRLPGILDHRSWTKPRPPWCSIISKFSSTRILSKTHCACLQGISRNRSVVASWNGNITGGKLIYAETGHPEYRSYDLADTVIVDMDGTATIDSEKNTTEAGQA